MIPSKFRMLQPTSPAAPRNEQKAHPGSLITPTKRVVIEVSRVHRVNDVGPRDSVFRVEHVESSICPDLMGYYDVRVPALRDRPKSGGGGRRPPWKDRLEEDLDGFVGTTSDCPGVRILAPELNAGATQSGRIAATSEAQEGPDTPRWGTLVRSLPIGGGEKGASFPYPHNQDGSHRCFGVTRIACCKLPRSWSCSSSNTGGKSSCR